MISENQPVGQISSRAARTKPACGAGPGRRHAKTTSDCFPCRKHRIVHLKTIFGVISQRRCAAILWTQASLPVRIFQPSVILR
jgi:hypothetical protein